MLGDPSKMFCPVPASGTINRETGEISFDWVDSVSDAIRMVQIFERVQRINEAYREQAENESA